MLDTEGHPRKFVRALDGHRLAGPIGRVGAAGDNEAMESFFSLLQKNVLDRRTWATRQELRVATGRRRRCGSRTPAPVDHFRKPPPAAEPSSPQLCLLVVCLG